MVVFLALGNGRLDQTVRDIEYSIRSGHAVTVVAINNNDWPTHLEDSVRWILLHEREQKSPFLRAERVAVLRIPQLFARTIRKIFVTLATMAGRNREDSIESADGWMQFQHRQSMRIHNVFGRWYVKVRPYFLWRAGRAMKVVDLIGSDQDTTLVITDALSIPLGWHLANRSPQLDVSFFLDREALHDPRLG